MIVVLSGDLNDIRVKHGFVLLRAGLADQLILDAPNWTMYGRNLADDAAQYIQKLAPDEAGRTHICAFHSDSTVGELTEVTDCIHSVNPKAGSAIVVTSNFHTRRALATAQRLMPQYRWSAAAASDSRFDVHWWRDRECAKLALTEWQKLLWWSVVEQWTRKG